MMSPNVKEFAALVIRVRLTLPLAVPPVPAAPFQIIFDQFVAPPPVPPMTAAPPREPKLPVVRWLATLNVVAVPSQVLLKRVQDASPAHFIVPYF